MLFNILSVLNQLLVITHHTVYRNRIFHCSSRLCAGHVATRPTLHNQSPQTVVSAELGRTSHLTRSTSRRRDCSAELGVCHLVNLPVNSRNMRASQLPGPGRQGLI